MARRPGPKTSGSASAPPSAPVRPASVLDAYDAADLAPATQGLWPRPPSSLDRPKISIVILSLDGEALLDRLLASFQQVNTYPEVEIIVVDHGSADGSVELLRLWAERLPVRIVARGANYGYSASNNYGARLASGELVLFLNNDIVFTEDVLGEMVQLLSDDRVGVVGLKQYQPALTPSGRRVYHLGVRFGWNVVERRLRPYHVRPGPLDARLSEEVASLPAVTASVMLCRRADFLAVGGFSEAYFYGLEDVDLCCRLRWRTGKAVVSLNSRSALHFKNSTRDRDAESRRPTEKANRRVLQVRCGYGIRREFVRARQDDDGSFTGSRFVVGIAVDAETALAEAEARGRAFGLGEALRRSGWDVRYLPRDAWDSAAELDLYIAATPGPSAAGLIDPQPHLTTVRWLAEGEEPGGADLAGWDLLLCPSGRGRAALPEPLRARSVAFLPAADPDVFAPGPVRPGQACDYLIVGDRRARTSPAVLGLDPEAAALNLRVLGEGWERHAAFAPYLGGPVDRRDLYRAYASAAATVIDRDLRVGDGPGQSLLEALMAGSLPLTNDAGAAELLGEEAPVWSDIAGLGALLNRWCAQGQEREALVAGLRRKALQAHVWSCRAGQLRDLVRARLAEPRVAIKSGEGDGPLAAALELAMLRAGMPARIDAEPEWSGVRAIGDDAVVALPGAGAYRPSADQINLRLADAASADVEFDEVLPLRPPRSRRRRPGPDADELAARVVEAIRAADRRRVLGPEDAPATTPQPLAPAEPAAAEA